MKVGALTGVAIMSLTFSVAARSADRSLKGSSLENHEDKSPQQRQQERIDIRSAVGGAMGGSEGGRVQQRQEEHKKNESALSCKEALERCSVK
jgi:hypothetical protein